MNISDVTSNEFSPYEYLNRVIDLWWLIALATILGGVFGYIFYHLHPPLYEATATYIVNVDLNRFPFQGVKQDNLQYTEDMALNITKAILLSPEVRDNVISQLKTQGISLAPYELLQNYTIERKQDTWELRYRSQDPNVAQEVVNSWANIGYQAMLSWQESGKAANYVVFQPPTMADIPQIPVLYDRNKVILAGAMIGFIIGIITSHRISLAPRKRLN
jgi:uncharacterized protein involved in exopolysaccharide biosynthesis